MTDDTPARRTVRGGHVLAALLGFFGVMLAVNTTFVYLAVTTFAGLDTPDAYRKGLAYNETIADAGAQAALGWSARLALDAGSGELTLSIADGAGRPVRSLVVAGRLSRPATDRFDRAIGPFLERAPGTYALALDHLEHGAWIADLEAARPAGGEASFKLRERLWVAPSS